MDKREREQREKEMELWRLSTGQNPFATQELLDARINQLVCELAELETLSARKGMTKLQKKREQLFQLHMGGHDPFATQEQLDERIKQLQSEIKAIEIKQEGFPYFFFHRFLPVLAVLVVLGFTWKWILLIFLFMSSGGGAPWG
jgi:hypothetical protein